MGAPKTIILWFANLQAVILLPLAVRQISIKNDFEVFVGVGFFFTGLGLYLVRRVKTRSSQPIFYIFGTFMLMLALYALYWFL